MAVAFQSRGGSRKRDGGIVKARLYHKTIPQSPAVTAPFTQGSLIYAVPLRIVGSGFCPILSQRERGNGARWAPPMAVDIHALCLPQTQASGKRKICNQITVPMLSFFILELIQSFLTIPLLKLLLCYNISRSRRRLTFISLEV